MADMFEQDDELKRLMDLQKDYEDKKSYRGAFGGAADMLASAPTRGQVMYGWTPGKTNFKSQMEQSAGSDPLAQQSDALKMQGTLNDYSMNKELRDPTSQKSVDARNSARKILGGVNPEFAESITDSMSGADVDKFIKEGLAGKAMSGLLGLQGRQITADRYNRGLDLKERGLNLREGDQAAKAAGAFDNDKILTQSQIQKNKLSQAAHTLDAKLEDPGFKITPQIWAEIQTDIATAIAQGGSNAAGQEAKKEFSSLQLDATNFKQRLTGTPQDINNPELIKYARSLIGRLGDSYQKNMAARAGQIANGRTYRANKEAQGTVKSKMDEYQKGDEAPTAKKAMPKTVVQGGHTYTLNEKTGEYE